MFGILSTVVVVEDYAVANNTSGWLRARDDPARHDVVPLAPLRLFFLIQIVRVLSCFTATTNMGVDVANSETLSHLFGKLAVLY